MFEISGGGGGEGGFLFHSFKETLYKYKTLGILFPEFHFLRKKCLDLIRILKFKLSGGVHSDLTISITVDSQTDDILM